MTTAFEQLLYIYGDAICGRKTVLPKDCDREAIAKKAMEQNILPLVYFNLFGEETDNKYYTLVMQAIAVNERKMFLLNKLSGELSDAGIEHCILKGSSLASLYAMPEMRISGDIDILIRENDEKRTMKFLEERNFVVKDRPKGGQNFDASHSMAGLYEFHVKLFDSEFDKYVLKEKFRLKEPFTLMTNLDGTKIKTLGINDGLYFVTAHMIKHFVKDGLGLRQISDWLLYIQRYRDLVDMQQFDRVMEELEFGNFINSIYSVGQKYFKMEFDCSYTEDPADVLSDMDEGGSFGHSDIERSKYKKKLLNSLYDKGELLEKAGVFKRLFYIAFPGRRMLVSKGYLKKNSSFVFIPAAWIRRWLDILRTGKIHKIESVAGRNVVNEEKLKKRQQILQKYRFIK